MQLSKIYTQLEHVRTKKHFTPTEHLENFLNNKFTLAYNFLICLFTI